MSNVTPSIISSSPPRPGMEVRVKTFMIYGRWRVEELMHLYPLCLIQVLDQKTRVIQIYQEIIVTPSVLCCISSSPLTAGIGICTYFDYTISGHWGVRELMHQYPL